MEMLFELIKAALLALPKKLFLFLVKKSGTLGWIFSGDDDRRTSRRCKIMFRGMHIRQFSIAQLEGLGVKKGTVSFRLFGNTDAEVIAGSMRFDVEFNELPISVILQVTWNLLIYRIIPISMVPIRMKFEKNPKLVKLIEEKYGLVENVRYNMGSLL